jgi:hypothetical protein
MWLQFHSIWVSCPSHFHLDNLLNLHDSLSNDQFLFLQMLFRSHLMVRAKYSIFCKKWDVDGCSFGHYMVLSCQKWIVVNMESIYSLWILAWIMNSFLFRSSYKDSCRSKREHNPHKSRRDSPMSTRTIVSWPFSLGTHLVKKKISYLFRGS